MKSYITNGYVINSDKITNDRYVIIDNTNVFNIGASLKNVGHKTFNINLMSDFREEAFKRVDEALRKIILNKEPINFNTVMKKANVSKLLTAVKLFY